MKLSRSSPIIFLSEDDEDLTLHVSPSQTPNQPVLPTNLPPRLPPVHCSHMNEKQNLRWREKNSNNSKNSKFPLGNSYKNLTQLTLSPTMSHSFPITLLSDDEEDSPSPSKRARTSSTLLPLFFHNWIPSINVPDAIPCTKRLRDLIPTQCSEVWVLQYCVDLNELSFLNNKVVVLCADFKGSDAVGQGMREMFEKEFTMFGSRLVKPEIPTAYGSHHSKLFFVICEHGCRVVVHTSNLEHSNLYIQTEGFWMQDFPIKVPNMSSSSGSSGSSDGVMHTTTTTTATDFETTLARVLTASGIKEAKEILKKFDFSTAEVALVANIPRHTAYADRQSIEANGLGRVEALLKRECALHPTWGARIKTWPVVIQSSSLGSQNSNAMKGENWLVAELGSAMGQSDPEKLQLVVATMKDVQNSAFGMASGGSTFFNLKHFSSPTIQSILYKWTPNNPYLPSREGLIPHFKSYASYEPTRGRELAWFILGSHNATKAAWGYYTSPARDKLTCISYELSVMFLPSIMRAAGSRRWNVESKSWSEVGFRDVFVVDPFTTSTEAFLPVPYALPLTKYDFSKDMPFHRD